MNSKMPLIIIALIALAFLSYPVKAQQGITFNETFFFAGGGTNGQTPATNNVNNATTSGLPDAYIAYLYNNFDQQKTVSRYLFPNTYAKFGGTDTATLTAAATGINTQYVTFTATVNGISFGSGNIGWFRTTGNNFQYDIQFASINSTYASTLTGTRNISLTYNTSVYSQFITSVHGDGASDCTGTTYFEGQIVAFGNLANRFLGCLVGGQSVSFSFSDTSTLTFNDVSTDFGWVNLSKNAFNQREIISNSTGYVYYDVTSTSDVAQYMPKSTGLNSSTYDVTAAGWANRTLVTASGAVVTPTATPTPAPTPPPASSTTGAALSWDKTSYNINDVGNLTGNLTVSPPFLGYFWIGVANSTGFNLKTFTWDSSPNFPQIESFLFSFPYQDAFTATMYSHSPFTGDSVVATATTQAKTPQSYIFAPSTVNTGANISISYIFNPVPTSGAIEDVITDQFGFNGVGTYINTTLCPCNNNTNSINYIINGVGKHTLRLWDTQNIKIVASTIVQVTSSNDIVPGNITNNLLLLDNTNYSVNDVINAQYQISSLNWTKYGYFKSVLASSGGVGMGFATLTSQTGTFQIPVTGGAFNIFQSGAAFVNVTGGNTTIDPNAVILMSAPITLLSSANGYSISVQPNTICLTQTATAKYTAPSGTGILQTEYMTPAGTTKFINTSFTSNGTQQFVFNDGLVKDQSGIIYTILDASGNFQVNTIIKYQSTGCVVPGTNPTPAPTAAAIPSGSTAVSQMGQNLTNLMAMPFFWGIMIFSITIVYCATRKPPIEGVDKIAFILAFIEDAAGMFAPFTVYVFIGIIIIAMLHFRKGKETVTGE